MSIIYKKVQEIIGPLLFLKNEHDVSYGEIVKIRTDNETTRTGQVVKINEDIIVVEVFEDTKGLSSENSEILFTEENFKLKLSNDMIGRTFNSLGNPIDVNTKTVLKSHILPDVIRDINGAPINPFARLYPSQVIQTGISAIDGLFTLIRGQKLPIFSGQGMSHNKLAAQLATQARV